MSVPDKDDQLWNAFMKTGRIDDYLRFRGVDIYDVPVVSSTEEAPAHAGDNRRPDHSGKQQYR